MTLRFGIKSLLTAVCILCLVSCSDDYFIDDFDSIFQYENSAAITLVNATNHMLNFHLKTDNIADPSDEKRLFKDKYSVQDNTPAYSVGYKINHDFSHYEDNIHIGIIDSINLTNEYNSIASLKNNVNYWAIALRSNNAYRVQLIRAKPISMSGRYNIRLLTNSPIELNYLNPDNRLTQQLKLKQGQLSQHISVENCNTDIAINEVNLNLCSATSDRSYLLVMDYGQMVMMLEE